MLPTTHINVATRVHTLDGVAAQPSPKKIKDFCVGLLAVKKEMELAFANSGRGAVVFTTHIACDSGACTAVTEGVESFWAGTETSKKAGAWASGGEGDHQPNVPTAEEQQRWLTTLEVKPWGNFVPALNVLVSKAAKNVFTVGGGGRTVGANILGEEGKFPHGLEGVGGGRGPTEA